jgi:hypothetical protein
MRATGLPPDAGTVADHAADIGDRPRTSACDSRAGGLDAQQASFIRLGASDHVASGCRPQAGTVGVRVRLGWIACVGLGSVGGVGLGRVVAGSVRGVG